jgi:hypothetical protein
MARESNQAKIATAGPPSRYALVFVLRTEALRRAAGTGRRAAFRAFFRGDFFGLFFAAFFTASFADPGRRFEPIVRGRPRWPSPTSRAIRRTIVSSMLTLRARQACLNFRCTPSGTLRMSMLPMISTVARIGGSRQATQGVCSSAAKQFPHRAAGGCLASREMLSSHAGYRSMNATSSAGFRAGLVSSPARCFSESRGDGSAARRPTMTSVTTDMPSGAPTAAAAVLSV